MTNKTGRMINKYFASSVKQACTINTALAVGLALSLALTSISVGSAQDGEAHIRRVPSMESDQTGPLNLSGRLCAGDCLSHGKTRVTSRIFFRLGCRVNKIVSCGTLPGPAVGHSQGTVKLRNGRKTDVTLSPGRNG